MRKEYLALFDLDGTLFDTNEVNFCAYRDALSRHGVILDREFFVRECNGRHYTEFLPKLLQDPVAIEAVHKEKKTDYVHNSTDEGSLSPGRSYDGVKEKLHGHPLLFWV